MPAPKATFFKCLFAKIMKRGKAAGATIKMGGQRTGEWIFNHEHLVASTIGAVIIMGSDQYSGSVNRNGLEHHVEAKLEPFHRTVDAQLVSVHTQFTNIGQKLNHVDDNVTRAKVAAGGHNPRMFAGSHPGPL